MDFDTMILERKLMFNVRNWINLEALVKLENEGLKVYPSPKNTKTDSE
jgi:hypothetical protein